MIDNMTNQEVIELWFRYEEIAMHFNELIISFRLQLLAGLGALSGVLSFLINNKIEDDRLPWVRATVSSVLLIVFCAAVSLDLFYYQELLSGAVKAIIELEKLHPVINMSTTIKQEVSSFPIIYLAYGTVLVPLLIYTVVAWVVYFSKRA